MPENLTNIALLSIVVLLAAIACFWHWKYRRALLREAVLRHDLNNFLTFFAAEDFEARLRRSLPENIKLSIPGDKVCPSLPEAGDMYNILLNLIKNACEAMPAGGQITVASGKVFLPQNLSPEYLLPAVAGKYFHLSVADTGGGIAPDRLSQIFKAGVGSKKETGHGLGLYSVGEILKKNGGTLRVETSGQGSCFHIYLPLPSDKTVDVLIFDDDILSAKMLKEVVTRCGGRGFVCADEALALDCLKQNRSLRLALLDIMPPQNNGLALYKRLRSLSPGLDIIFVSGVFPQPAALKKILSADSKTGFIAKPWRPEEMQKCLRRLLAKN